MLRLERSSEALEQPGVHLWNPTRNLHMSRSQASETNALEVGVPPMIEKDHALLCNLLNKPRSGESGRDVAGPPTGLFKIEALREPRAFLTLAQTTLYRAQLLVNRIARAGEEDVGMDELRRVVRSLDRLSDLLCGVIDMAELVRHAHPDPTWADAANAAYEHLCNFMNILNTHTGLYVALKRAMDDHAVWQSLSEEARAVAIIFLRDFEKSGIHLPPQERERFVELSDQILVLGRAFLQDTSASAPDSVTEIPVDLLEGMDSQLLSTLMSSAEYNRRRNVIAVVPNSWEAHCISKHAPNSQARRLAYMASYTGRHNPVAILESLLKARDNLSKLTGKRSFAEMTLVDKMAGTPRNVENFLRIISQAQQPAAQSLLEKMSAMKQKLEEGSQQPPALQAWDRDFYAEAYARAHRASDLPSLSPYLSLGSVFTGLSRLFYLLYGIHFRAASVQPGELWSPDVLKLDVVDENEGGVIGTIYCDLFSRPGKPSSAAHYTVRCSRRVDMDDTECDMKLGWANGMPQDIDMSNLLNVKPVTSPGRTGVFQQPVVVLMTDFQWPSPFHGGISLLRWHEVETLFHEMGHAVHSMIGRTEFHNVSGTRCATDLVELPSILMEHFLTDKNVIQLAAHHHKSGAPLPYNLLVAHLHTNSKLDALDAQQQILLAALDQWYHSERVGEPGFSTVAGLEELQSQMGMFPVVPNSTWQGQFGHLFGYGATYYSYLFDRAIAARVWQKLFSGNPLSREAGEKFKKEMLQHGGGKNPWSMLSSLLDDEQIAVCDEQAMETIGRWGLGHVAP
ncbi:mitochondrial intermediate peptidase [Malassezia vespertilionis]|uniref:mitochondrial intermediate peptidase n=1 Tax=Malassezia vespertilionis TaxID=2020962 RepID=UPI0024B114FE|nr:mitochondrial intermediate peptidase [Malassezia vespertilionis]WFD07075.1 mitochondrial intermediate peptidase [Malassezia vespertilionis]